MKNIDYDDLLKFARTLDGKILQTDTFGDEFTVTVKEGGFDYILTSGQSDRFHDANVVKQFLAMFNEVQSLESDAYRSTPANDAFFLAVVGQYLQIHPEISQWPEPHIAYNMTTDHFPLTPPKGSTVA